MTLCAVTDTEKGEEAIAFLALEIRLIGSDGLRSMLMVSSSPNWHHIDIIQINVSIVYLIVYLH
jgi:hypothetical protein